MGEGKTSPFLLTAGGCRMSWNPFTGMSQADLEALLQRAQADLAAGKSTVAAGDGSIMIKSSLSNRPETRIKMILRALSIINPVQYPPGEVTPTTETRVVFGAADPNQ